MALVMCVVNGVAPLVSASYNLAKGTTDTREWFHSYKLVYVLARRFNAAEIRNNCNSFFLWSIPFHQHTALEYFLQIPLDIAFAYFYIVALVTVLMFFVSCCLLLECRNLHMKSVFMEIDELTMQPNTQNNKKIDALLLQLIKLHVGMTE